MSSGSKIPNKAIIIFRTSSLIWRSIFFWGNWDESEKELHWKYTYFPWNIYSNSLSKSLKLGSPSDPDTDIFSSGSRVVCVFFPVGLRTSSWKKFIQNNCSCKATGSSSANTFSNVASNFSRSALSTLDAQMSLLAPRVPYGTVSLTADTFRDVEVSNRSSREARMRDVIWWRAWNGKFVSIVDQWLSTSLMDSSKA